MKHTIILAAAFAASLASGSAAANDTSGFQGTTGIELAATDDIRMVSEDLAIGLDEIRVAYVFRNVTAHPVETMVVFPLPDLDLSQGLSGPNWNFPAGQPDFLKFRLWIDGRPATPTLERRAFFHGRDVTRELEDSGAMDLVPWRGDYDEQVKSLPATTLARLRREGLLQQGEDTDTPQWRLRTRYFWTQTFPAGTDVAVRHSYRPFVGLALIGGPSGIDGRSVVGRYVGDEHSGTDRYCLDAATRRALAEVEHRRPTDPMPFTAAEIEYILTTARNWRGPIGRFRLTLDKGAPDNILSLCWDGALRKTGPATFESTLTDFSPTRDIRLLIFVRSHQP